MRPSSFTRSAASGMFSRLRARVRRTAAWRLSAVATVVFALGTAAVFAAAYLMLAAGIQRRGDDWLDGETAALADVAATAPREVLKQEFAREARELANHRLSAPAEAEDAAQSVVFFALLDRSGTPLLVDAPSAWGEILPALDTPHFRLGPPRSVAIPGWEYPMRVASRALAKTGPRLLVGESLRGDQRLLDETSRTWRGFGRGDGLRFRRLVVQHPSRPRSRRRGHRGGGGDRAGAARPAPAGGETRRRDRSPHRDVQRHARPHRGLDHPDAGDRRRDRPRSPQSGDGDPRLARDRPYDPRRRSGAATALRPRSRDSTTSRRCSTRRSTPPRPKPARCGSVASRSICARSPTASSSSTCQRRRNVGSP